MSGIVYILINEAMPGFIKIGKTETDLARRISDLSNSSVPFGFECYYAARVADCAAVERLLHDAFADHRVNPRREFFMLEPERAKSALLIGALEEVTPGVEDTIPDEAERAAARKIADKRRRTTLADIGLRPGDILTLDRDEATTCEVVDHRLVRFRGETMSPSQAALSALRALGFDWPSANGWLHWTYQGRSLRDHVTEFLEL